MPTVTLNNARGQKAISLQGLTAAEWHELFGDSDGASKTPDVEKLAEVVGWMYRCIHLRASSLSSMPWTITRGDEEIASHDGAIEDEAYEWLGNLGDLLYLTEAALSICGCAYWYIIRDRRGRVIEPRWFAPGTMAPAWSATAGLTHFERRIGSMVAQYQPEDIVYTRLPNAMHETRPGLSPAAAAASDAGVVFNLNAFVQGYFERGAIRATLLTVQGNMRPDDRERLKSWWQRMISGVSNAWGAGVIGADNVTPIQVGDGIESLNNSELMKERREGISTAMGVPHSLVMSNAANYATADSDKLLFYEGTIVPQSRLVSSAINRQLLAPLGLHLRFDHNQLMVFQEDERRRSAAFGEYVRGGLLPSVAAQILGVSLPEGMDYGDLDEGLKPQQVIEAELATPIRSVQVAPDDDDGEAKRTEAGQLRRWLKRKGPDANLDDFEAMYLSNVEKRVAWVSLYGEAVEDGAAEDTPFSQALQSGRITREAWKAMRLQLDPEDNEAEQRARDGIENGFRNELQTELQRWKNQIVPANGTDADARTAPDRVASTSGRVRDVLRKWLLISADLGVNIAIDQLEGAGIGFDYTLAHNRAAQWASRYVGELIGGITNTTLQRVRDAVSDFFTNGDTMRDLRRELERTFDPKRAELIASTEATRAAAEGSKEAYRESGVVSTMEWRTANDEAVCPICGPLGGLKIEDGVAVPRELGDQMGATTTLDGQFTHPDTGQTYDAPPAHPRCRCWIIPVIADA